MSAEGCRLRDLLVVMVEAVVEQPAEASVQMIEGETSVIFELRVARKDLPRLIGKGAVTIKSIRKLLSAAATKLRKKTMLQVVE